MTSQNDTPFTCGNPSCRLISSLGKSTSTVSPPTHPTYFTHFFGSFTGIFFPYTS